MTKEDLKQKLSDFLLQLRLEEKSKRTIDKYHCDILKFIDSINHQGDITKEDVIVFKEKIMESEYKPSSINSFIVAINKFLIWNSLSDLKVKKIKTQQASSLEDVISVSDYARLLRVAKKMNHHEIYMIMKIIATTGIRIGELKYFTVESIKSFFIHVRNKGKDRDIIMTQELARELRKYCKDHGVTSGVIFDISEVTIWRRMKKIASVAKVNKRKVHAHSFRHLFAKEFMDQYNNPLDLADILGHKSLETTRIYTRSTNEEKRKKMERMKGKK